MMSEFNTETQMSAFQEAHNDVVDSVTSQKAEIMWLKSKVADLEDRSCCNNLKFRGIPELVLPQDLAWFIQ